MVALTSQCAQNVSTKTTNLPPTPRRLIQLLTLLVSATTPHLATAQPPPNPTILPTQLLAKNTPGDSLQQVHIDSSQWISPYESNDSSDVLEVCECHSSVAQAGLMCHGEGYFAWEFIHTGTWQGDGSVVPLNPVQCCKLCVPEDTPQFYRDATQSDTRPIGVLSLGCHVSTDIQSYGMMCEQGSSYVGIGFETVRFVPGQGTIFYPHGPITCCQPVMLMTDSRGLELAPCNCEKVNSVSCPAPKLLVGFNSFVLTIDGRRVPTNSTVCCDVCYTHKVIDDKSCAQSQMCHNNGLCMLGVCECFNGWTGPDCSIAHVEAVSGPSTPTWLVILIIFLTCIVSSVLFGIIKALSEHYLRSRNGDSLSSGLGEPLLRMHGDGSAGSQDTIVSGGDTSASDGTISVELGASVAGATKEEPSSSAALQGSGVQVKAAEAGAASGKSQADKMKGEWSGEPVLEESSKESQQIGTVEEAQNRILKGTMCSICWSRPVQVALVPCGHASLCRKCSRRLDVCPFCRKAVARRQRIYMTS